MNTAIYQKECFTKRQRALQKQGFNPNSRILYRGPSQLNGDPIVVVVTGLKANSANAKTGEMLQTWILVDSAHSPSYHAAEGCDEAICGDCPHRPITYKAAGVRRCYVRVYNAPRSVWESLQKGRIATASNVDLAEMKSRKLRIGSYGDPAAVPTYVWQACMGKTWTGYTHQWRLPQAQTLKGILMASTDTPKETIDAHRMGWRTFRVIADKQAAPAPGREVLCPASKEAGHKTTCANCTLCKGLGINAKSVAIHAH